MASWRFLDTGPGGPQWNMAVDEALARSVRLGQGPPTLRLYGWQCPAVSLGRFQRSSDTNLEYCTTAGIPVVRRPTGGRGILHAPGGWELTYSFAAPAGGDFGHSVRESYRALARAFQRALTGLGVSVHVVEDRPVAHGRSALCFLSSSYGEIMAGGLKVVGSAQRRWPEGFLQQGSIPLLTDRSAARAVFGGGAESATLGGLRDVAPSVDRELLAGAVRDALEETFGVSLMPGEVAREEEEYAGEALERKYLNPAWTFRR
jgi:lipoate-protein ligase A